MAGYDQIAQMAAIEMSSTMSFCIEWLDQPLPLEDKDGAAMQEQICKMINRSIKDKPALEHFVKPKNEPPVMMDKPPPPPKENILCFSDSLGYCQKIFEYAPEGRIGEKKVVQKPARAYTQDEVDTLFGDGWDMVIFGAGLDPPKSNSTADVIAINTGVTKLFYHICKTIQKKEGCLKKLCVLTRGYFSDDPDLHKEMGLSMISHGTLFGMCNTARQELDGVAIQYIDTEYKLEQEMWDREDYKLMPRLASEVFRSHTFGHDCVRLLNTGRYVGRQMTTKDYRAANVKWRLPAEGIVGISGGNGALALVMGGWLLDKAEQQKHRGFPCNIQIQFLSRSMKISDLNMPNWKKIQKRAEQLGIEVEQAKMDMSTQQAVDDYVKSVTPNLIGFIHSAGVLQDSMIMNLTWEKCETVFDSKHRAALYLHDSLERFSNPNLMFYWMFSSVSVYGNMGQLNYSGSNAFLDGIARHRIAAGKPATTIQWGAWGEVGMAATMDDVMKRRTDLGPCPYFTNVEGLRGLDEGLSTGLPYFSVYKINPQVFFGMIYPSEGAMACYTRNWSSEMAPTMPVPSMEDKHLYTVYRDLRGSAIEMGSDRLLYKTFTEPKVQSRKDSFFQKA